MYDRHCKGFGKLNHLLGKKKKKKKREICQRQLFFFCGQSTRSADNRQKLRTIDQMSAMETKEGNSAVVEVVETKETKEAAEPAGSLPETSQTTGNNLI
jgi:hypothetical protein